MAYYLYKTIRDKRRQHRDSNVVNDSIILEPTLSGHVESPVNFHKPSRVHDATTHATDEPTEQQPPKHEATIYRTRLFLGLFFPALLQSLNLTMIAGALPYIASAFDELPQLNWIVSAYNLTSAACIPAWAQFADIFGRYATAQAAVFTMLVGSTICAAAPTSAFPMLLAGRGLQGVGVSGIMIVEKTILADRVSLRENAKNNSIFTLIVAIGYGVGPVVGGHLTAISWRWVFIINLPLAVAGIVLLHFASRPVLLGPQDLVVEDGTQAVSASSTIRSRLATVDFGGQVLFLFGMGLVILALTWAGASYSWADAHVVAPLVVGVVLLVIFLVWESLLLPGRLLARWFPSQQPMIPLRLVFSRNAGLLMYINFVTGMAMYAVLYFVGLYFSLVQGFSSSQSGTNLLYYTPGLGIGAALAMFSCNSWPRRTWWPLVAGTTIEALGVTLLAAAIAWGHLPTIYGMLGLTGVGTGIRFMPGTLHGVAYYRDRVAMIVALMAMAVALGGTLASTLMLNIFNNLMSRAGVEFVAIDASSASSGSSSMAGLSVNEQQAVQNAARHSIMVAFYAITSFLWLGLVAMAFLGNVDIAKQRTSTVENGQAADGLTQGSYLSHLLRRKENDIQTTPQMEKA